MMSTAALLSPSFTAFFLLLASVFLSPGSSSQPPPSSCANELVRFSPCLSYVASPPNNLSSSPASKCCHAFSSAEDSDSVVCLCYLVQDPPMLGFPVSVARLLSLPSLCPRRNSTATAASNSSYLKSLCSEVPELPPLRSFAIPVNLGPPHLSGPETASPPPPNPLNPANESTTQPSSAVEPAIGSAVEPARGSADLPRVSSSATATPCFKSSTGWFLPAVLMLVLICV